MLPARRKATEPPAKRPVTMAAARVDLTKPSWQNYKLRNEVWQIEAWRFYDLIGELRFAANYIGSACSRVRIYVAEVDDFGRVGAEAEKEDIQALADTLFGTPAAKAEILRSIGINLTVAGECYIIGYTTEEKEDEWCVVAGSEIRRQGENLIVNLGKNLRETIRPQKDLVIRVWTPHPRFNWNADSPTRGAMLALRQIEQLTKYTFSQIDSRLAGAGLLVIPPNMDFPQAPDASPVETMVELIGEAASASMEQDGTAKAVVPVIVERPEGAGEDNRFEHIKFESELSDAAPEMLDRAIQRLALAMDIPPEILSGTGDTNHWSAWHIEESAVKIHVEPMMNRICDALTKAYLAPLLKVMNEEPGRYTFWFDTAPLTVRPNRLQDTLNLYERGIVSSEAVLVAGSYNPNTDAPDDDEDTRRFMRELVLRDPTLFAVPEVREACGLDIEIATPPAEMVPGAEGAGPPPPPAPQRSIEQSGPQAPPSQPTQPSSTTSAGGDGFVASAEPVEYVQRPPALLIAADLLVHRALELAGKRLHRSRDKDRWQHVPSHQLHTYLKVRDHEHAEKLLLGAWEHMAVATGDLEVSTSDLRSLLHRYSKELLVRSVRHDRGLLRLALERGGLIRG